MSSPAVSQAWHGSSGVILFLAFLFLLPSCTMCGWAARRCLEATLRVSRALARTFLPFGAGHDLFRNLHTGWLAGPNVAKCRQMHFCFATTGADPDVHQPRDTVRRNQRLNRPFQSSFLFSIFHFFVLFLRAFGYDPQERFFSSAFPGRSGHRGPSRFFLADCSLRSFVRAGLGNMLFRRARWVVVTARV